MPKTTAPITASAEVPKVPEGVAGFIWKGSVVTVKSRTVRDREAIRLLVARLANEVERGEITTNGLAEFAAIVVLTQDGDSAIWGRPSPKAALPELLAALETWGDFPTALADAWMEAIYSDEGAAKN